MEELWQRVSEKRVTALLGQLWPEPPSSLHLRVLRISCDGPHGTLGPLLEAAHRVEELLGGPVPLFNQARKRVALGLRRRILGDAPAGRPDSLMIETLNRLDIDSDRPSVVVFDAVDAADDATLDALTRIMGRPGWLRVPIVLTFKSKDLSGRPAALLRALQEAYGEEAILVARSGSAETKPESIAFNWPSLPPDLLRIMRAGALIGSGFEADLVAELLRADALDVLEQLQRVVDLGAPLSDRGEGCFYLSDDDIEKLRAGILPSVARAWHKKLAQILSDVAGVPPMSALGAPSAPLPTAPPPPPPPPPWSTSAPAPVAAQAQESQTVTKTAEQEITGPMPSGPVSEGESTVRWPLSEPPAAAPSPPSKEPAAPAEDTETTETSDVQRPQWPYSQIFGRPGDGPIASSGPSISEKQAPEASGEQADGEKNEATEEEAISSGRDSGDRKTLLSAGEMPQKRAPVENVLDNAKEYWFNPFVISPVSVTAPSKAAEPVSQAPKERMPESKAAPPEFELDPGAEKAYPSRADGGRAAQHLSAAGDLESAAAHYLKACQEAAEAGAYDQALAYSRKALSVLDSLPISPKRRILRIRILMELGRLQWNVTGPDASFTLSGALEMLNAAEMLLKPDDPPKLWAEVMQLLAALLYDIGDMSSLARALDALTKASRVLLDVGDAVGAARLLNDQAAVYVRMGDPVRAVHLLSESRKIFEEKAASDPEAMLELAETDHLFARIPLHVEARPGRESDALLMGLDHAIAAERTYKKLDMQRELGRVWETMGRLELRRKRHERAAAKLSAAIGLQDAIGDVIGLARSTAAMSEVLCAHGQFQKAAALLADSASLNLEKGSPIGLAFNRRALELLKAKAPPGEEMAHALRSVELRIKEAEGILGRLTLPGERD